MAKTDFNQVHIIGRLTKDVELKYTGSGMAIAEFTIAVNQCFKQEEKVFFFSVTSFGKGAELNAKFIGKGSQVLVSGSLDQQRYTTKDGIKKSSVKINAQNVTFLGSPRNQQEQTQQRPYTTPAVGNVPPQHSQHTQPPQNVYEQPDVQKPTQQQVQSELGMDMEDDIPF